MELSHLPSSTLKTELTSWYFSSPELKLLIWTTFYEPYWVPLPTSSTPAPLEWNLYMVKGQRRLFHPFTRCKTIGKNDDVVNEDITPTNMFDPYLSTFPILINVVIRSHSLYGVSISIAATTLGATLLALQSYHLTTSFEEQNSDRSLNQSIHSICVKRNLPHLTSCWNGKGCISFVLSAKRVRNVHLWLKKQEQNKWC